MLIRFQGGYRWVITCYGFLFIIQTHGSTPLCSCLCYCLKISNRSQQNVAVKADYLPSSLTYHRLLCFEKKIRLQVLFIPWIIEHKLSDVTGNLSLYFLTNAASSEEHKQKRLSDSRPVRRVRDPVQDPRTQTFWFINKLQFQTVLLQM